MSRKKPSICGLVVADPGKTLGRAHIGIAGAAFLARSARDHRIDRNQLAGLKISSVRILNIGAGFVSERDRIIERKAGIGEMAEIVHVRAADTGRRQAQPHPAGFDGFRYIDLSNGDRLGSRQQRLGVAHRQKPIA